MTTYNTTEGTNDLTAAQLAGEACEKCSSPGWAGLCLDCRDVGPGWVAEDRTTTAPVAPTYTVTANGWVTTTTMTYDRAIKQGANRVAAAIGIIEATIATLVRFEDETDAKGCLIECGGIRLHVSQNP